MVPSRGLFITVEGGEGAGKSTNIAGIQAYLQSRGVDLVVTREPGGTRLGEDVREVLLRPREEPVVPMAELLLLFAARAQHVEDVILPALGAGKWVICDRFTDASYAYQCGGRGMPASAVRALESLVQGELRPDYTLLLDTPVDTGLERVRGRGDLDRFEREELAFFQRVRETYLQLARESSGRYHLVDASQPLEGVQARIEEICEELFACWAPRHPVAR
ncbi:MAG TPA: dTMP kinase [Halieaceae bacterium]|jgi:dTMP kinase|uniref:dTMP kinase n=1 Tax=Haliea TaxID=475794 RepID=UPI000C3EE89C|nr:dTMP kinase [Haliea sp.]HBM85126.1 dTMP kinase [Halieaceae bacterium]MAD64432.1 dTMP kinase [Haliea sp.]MAY91710.1 dTMP kinase [Haliea sp.]MBP70436.1 dTMP kinase [Haliea sp.]HBQ41289.1 dTMP kinase [Halieaceae bacterium]|tara:strand:- start:2839 stop:3498 length:660 start_codon:yes stop_codon:yes gene_type:complete